MKSPTFARRIWLLCLLTPLVVVTAALAEPRSGQAVVRSIKGSASANATAGAWQRLKVGQVLPPGTTVKTEADSVVDLYLKDNGPVVRLTGNTTLVLAKLTTETAGRQTRTVTELDLRSGTILGNVRKLDADSRYEIKTLVGVASVRGTEYSLSAAGVLHVVKGTVDFAVVAAAPNGQVAGNVVSVGPGQSFVPPAALNTETVANLISGPTLPEVAREVAQQLPVVREGRAYGPLFLDGGRDIKIDNPNAGLLRPPG